MNTIIENEVIKVYIVEGGQAGGSLTEHNILSATHPDTLPASLIAGDLVYANTTPKWARLPKGSVDGKLLTMVSGMPAWADPPGAGGGGAPAEATYVVLSTHVDLTQERVLTAGNGILITDGGAGLTVTLATRQQYSIIQSSGVLQLSGDINTPGNSKLYGTDISGTKGWYDQPVGGTAHAILSATHTDTLVASVVAGDLIFGNSTPKWARLPKGTDGQILKLVGGYPAWTGINDLWTDSGTLTYLTSLTDRIAIGVSLLPTESNLDKLYVKMAGSLSNTKNESTIAGHIGNPDITKFGKYGYESSYFVASGVAGWAKVTAATTQYLVAGVTGFVEIAKSVVGGVGVIGKAVTAISSCQAWGSNFLVEAKPGFTGCTIYACELNVELYQSGTNILGLWIAGDVGVGVTPGACDAIRVGALGVFSSPQVKWDHSFRSLTGASNTAVRIDRKNSTSPGETQDIRFYHTDTLYSRIVADSIGSLALSSYGAYVALYQGANQTARFGYGGETAFFVYDQQAGGYTQRIIKKSSTLPVGCKYLVVDA